LSRIAAALPPKCEHMMQLKLSPREPAAGGNEYALEIAFRAAAA
jgi:hypothetical protein